LLYLWSLHSQISKEKNGACPKECIIIRFQCKDTDQNKHSDLHFCWSANLWAWFKESKSYMPFVVPMVSIEQKPITPTADFVCLTFTSTRLVCPNLPSALRYEVQEDLMCLRAQSFEALNMLQKRNYLTEKCL
jgi:hypothetical protein